MKISRIALIAVLALAGTGVSANNLSAAVGVSKYSSVNEDKKGGNTNEILPEVTPAPGKVTQVQEKVYSPEQKASIVELKLKSVTK